MDGMAGVIATILDQEVTLRRKLYSKIAEHKDKSLGPWLHCGVAIATLHHLPMSIFSVRKK